MRIVYSCFTKIGAGGLGVDSFELVRGIYARGYLQRGVFYGNLQFEIPKKYLRIIRLQPFQLFSSLPARYYYSMKRIYLDAVTARVIRKEGCDLFHGWTNEAIRSLQAVREQGGIGWVERPSAHPTVTRALLDEEYDLQGIARPKKGSLSFLAEIDAAKRDQTVALEEFDLADKVVVESEFSHDTFTRMGFPKEKLWLAPRGVDTERFHPAAQPPEDSTFRVLYIGQLSLRKGIYYLLKAWETLKLKNAELWVVGSVKEEMKKIAHRYEGNESIRFFGFIKDPVALFQKASLFVLPSIVEGSAKVTYEAMACGIPVVVTPNAGSVARDGEEGLIIPMRDPEALAEAISKLYHDRALLQTMAKKARLRMEAHSWEAHRERMILGYEEAWANRRPRQ